MYGYSGFIRNLSRNPGYGLRKRGRERGKGDARPAGPKLVRGRGRRRRTVPSAAAWTVFLILIALMGLVVIRLVGFMS